MQTRGAAARRGTTVRGCHPGRRSRCRRQEECSLHERSTPYRSSDHRRRASYRYHRSRRRQCSRRSRCHPSARHNRYRGRIRRIGGRCRPCHTAHRRRRGFANSSANRRSHENRASFRYGMGYTARSDTSASSTANYGGSVVKARSSLPPPHRDRFVPTRRRAPPRPRQAAYRAGSAVSRVTVLIDRTALHPSSSYSSLPDSGSMIRTGRRLAIRGMATPLVSCPAAAPAATTGAALTAMAAGPTHFAAPGASANVVAP